MRAKALAVTVFLAAIPALAVAWQGFPLPSLSVAWRLPLHTEPLRAWQPREHAGLVVVPGSSVAVAASAKGLTAVVAATGEVLWEVHTSERIGGRPVLRDATLYAATAAGEVMAYDVGTGRALWPQPTRLEAEVVAPLAADATRVFVTADPGMIAALDRQTGKPAWRHSAPAQREFLIEGQAGALSLGALVFTGTPGGSVLALSTRDGGVVWEASLARADRGPYADVDTTPVHVQRRGLVAGQDGDWLLAASHSGGLHALRAADGAVVWRYDVAGVSDIACDGTDAIVVGTGPRLHVIQVATGRAVIVRDLPSGAGGRVGLLGPAWLALSGESGLDLVARRTGRPWSRFALEAGFAQPPVIAGGRLVAVSNAGVVYGLQLHTDAM